MTSVALAMMSGFAFATEAGPAPFGAEVAEAVARYDRVTQTIAGGGVVAAAGYPILAEAGIRTVIDLRTSGEGVVEAREQAAAAGLRYFNLPVGAEVPSREVLEQFAVLTSDGDLQPVYFHCVSGARAGTVWAIHRLRQGIALDQAIVEGRTIGLSEERIAQVRNYPLAAP